MTDKQTIEFLLGCLKNTIWMAARYADGRMSAAPGLFNDTLEDLDKHGFGRVMDGDAARNGHRYVSDGDMGQYDPETKQYSNRTT